MRNHGILAAFILAAAMAGGAAPLKADELHVDKTAANRARFTATYAGQTFGGTTGKIDGYVFWKSADPDSGLFEGSDLYVEVDLNSLDTGIGLRNHHMKENYLHTGKYPFAAFKGKILKSARPGGGDRLVNVEGVMTIHGVGRPLALTGRVDVAGDRYRLSCSFPVDIREYGIEVPSLMGMKVSPVLTIDMDVMLIKFR